MALCFLPVQHEFVIDDFMVIDMGNREYRLCGVTLKGPWAVPNPIPWNKCYALGPNVYVIVSPISVSLLVNEQEVAKANCDSKIAARFSDSYLTRCNFYERAFFDGRGDYEFKGPWPKIKAYLKTISTVDEEAAEILRAMEEWETTSGKTLQWLQNKMHKWGISHDKTEMLISGTYWLVHYRHKRRWIAGNLENVWGEVRSPSKQAKICQVAPLKNGWVVKTNEGDWFLRRKGNNALELQKTVCPTGPWTTLGSWIYWRTEHYALSPAGRLIPVPRRAVMGSLCSRWIVAFTKSGELIMIEDTGATRKKAILGTNERPIRTLAGDSSIFVMSQTGQQIYFNIIPYPSQPFRFHLWRQIAFPSFGVHFSDPVVIRGNPDVFAMSLETGFLKKQALCFINTRGEVWCFPLNATWGGPRPSFEELGNGEAMVRVKDTVDETVEFKARVCDNVVQLDMGEGILISGEMAGFPVDQEDALWQFLRPFLEPRKA